MRWPSVIAIILCLLFSRPAMSNHVFGGDLLYTHVSGNTYRLTLTIYAECSDLAAFRQLPTAQPRINVGDGTATVFDGVVLNLKSGSGIEVSPVCPREISNTSCNGGTLPGINQYIYEGLVDLPYASRNWQFTFTSNLGNSIAGRNTSITNVSSGVTFMYLKATLDNSSAPNSSPQYTTIPSGYYCNNQFQQYNQGASDADGDSLAFSLVPAIDTASGLSVNYVTPFTATSPMATASGDFTFNRLNGQLDFTPNATQRSLLVTQVTEYRRGVIVGTSVREHTFIVRDDCSGTPPTPFISSVGSGTLQSGNVITICEGNPSVSFDVKMNNPEGDSINITPADVPSSATLTVTRNRSTDPLVSFNWNTSSLPAGIYSFLLNIQSNHCPISNNQTVAYTIRVVRPPSVAVTPYSLTRCTEKAAVKYDILNGFVPRTVSVFKDGVFLKAFLDTTGSDSSGTVLDSLYAGNYSVLVSSDSLCTVSAVFTIIDSGSLDVDPIELSVCRGAAPKMVLVEPVVPGASIQWFAADGTPLSGAPLVNTAVSGTYIWYFIEQYKSCSSGNIQAKVTVHDPPVASITSIPPSVCYGDQVYLKATGGLSYQWLPAVEVKVDTGGPYISIFTPVTVSLIATDAFGCTDTTSQEVNQIERCCRLSYPNAFTPNDDGKNDGWKVVTYGNMQRFKLFIYNRFGQLVFHSTDPRSRWDGTFLGQPCELGTYYFMVDAQCLTGPQQFYKGDIELIR